MLKKVGTFRITDESLDRHSERVIVAGIDLENFKANPILLYNHHRARSWDDGESKKILPIGRWDNVIKTEDAIFADAYIDVEDPLGKEVARKVELGILSAASIGFRALAWSDEDEDKVQGQKGYTITSSEIREVSIVDIPSNPNALVSAKMVVKSFDEGQEKANLDYYKRGSLVTTKAADNHTPKEKKAINNNSKSKNMFKQKFVTWLNENFGTSFKADDTDEVLSKGVDDLPTIESIKAKAVEDQKEALTKSITEKLKSENQKTIDDLTKSFDDKLEKLGEKFQAKKVDEQSAEEKAKADEAAKVKAAADLEKKMQDLAKQLSDLKGESGETQTQHQPGTEGIKTIVNNLDSDFEFDFDDGNDAGEK